MKTKNLMVSVLAAVLVVALWWTMLLKPTRAKASKVREETANERAKLAPLQTQLTQAQRAAAHEAEFKAQLKSLQLAMPDSPALAEFIRDANGIAQSSGVAWQSVTHGPPTAGAGGPSSITVGIQIKGSYPQVIDYLGQLAALKRLVVVDSVSLSAAGTTGTQTSGPQTSGGSTGPFSGASELSVTIAARMFESPSAALAAVPGSTTAAAPAATSMAPPAPKPEGLNNS